MCTEHTSSIEADETAEQSYLETLHFFGVFDGHGGAEAALHCAQTLHQRIAEALAAAIDPDGDDAPQTGGHFFGLPLAPELASTATSSLHLFIAYLSISLGIRLLPSKWHRYHLLA